MHRIFAAAFLFASIALTLPAAERPNVLYILTDDLGYGDVHRLNPDRGRMTTPCLDRLAMDGMSFTEAHSGSAVCTPTRYGILTGRYAWRTHLQNGVLHGFSAPLIAPERLTVPALLKQAGYETLCLGKWHLGMTIKEEGREHDFARPIPDGPVRRGFDHFFGIAASLDMPPFAFIEDDRFTELPTVRKKWLREGPAAPGFEAIDVLPTLTRRAGEFIRSRQGNAKPFFLYLALPSPHTPIVPTAEWQGRSGLGAYGDFVMQTDAAVGEVLRALDAAGLATNTLVLFTSDNGCSPAADTPALEKQAHFASADRRGYKADIFDGGHHIPFLARWPGRVAAGTTNDAVICLTDLMATCAELTGQKLPDSAGEDSASLLPLLRGERRDSPHEAVIHHSINGSFAIRQGRWKLALCGDSGGWSEPQPGRKSAALTSPQLFDLQADVGEMTNVAPDHPDVVAKLSALLRAQVENGRSTPGAPQTNDVPVKLTRRGGG